MSSISNLFSQRPRSVTIGLVIASGTAIVGIILGAAGLYGYHPQPDDLSPIYNLLVLPHSSIDPALTLLRGLALLFFAIKALEPSNRARIVVIALVATSFLFILLHGVRIVPNIESNTFNAWANAIIFWAVQLLIASPIWLLANRAAQRYYFD